MAFNFRRPTRTAAPDPAAPSPDGLRCESCFLAVCPAGLRATVLCLGCSAADADRLRTLGVFEGASVTVVGRRSGILLDVRGARLAIGRALAAAITVRPVST